MGLGIAYHKTGQYDKERKVYRKALKYFPEEPLILFRQVLLSYSEKDTAEATGMWKIHYRTEKKRIF